jgi:CheY-like chemotaxis protein
MSEVLATVTATPTLESKHDLLRPNAKSDGVVLIIDPLPSSASITAAHLQSWGYSIDIVHSFSAALELLKNGELIPDLIVVDILNTLHLKQSLRFPTDLKRETMWGHIPLIARSAMKEQATIIKVLRAGYTDYIIGPVEKEILKDRIDKVFHNTLAINHLTFPKPISASGSLILDIHLTSINEFGMEGFSNTRIADQTIFCLQTEILENIGLDQVMVKVVGCGESEGNDWKYKVAMTFVGISPAVQQRIRQFAMASNRGAIKIDRNGDDRH